MQDGAARGTGGEQVLKAKMSQDILRTNWKNFESSG